MPTTTLSNLALNLHIMALCAVATKYRSRLNVFDNFRLNAIPSGIHTYQAKLADIELGADIATPYRKLRNFASYELPKMVANIRCADGWSLMFDRDEVYARRAV